MSQILSTFKKREVFVLFLSIIIIFSLFSLSYANPIKVVFNKGLMALDRKDYDQAIVHFKKTIATLKKDIENQQQSARMSA